MTDLADHLQASLGGRYRILREIGRGGMAVVFLADDLKHDRRVALKVLDPGVVGAVAAERFHQEIRVAAGLQHPHVLPLFDSGEADGLFFYVMPYVEGESLRDRLDREGRLEISEALRITRELAAGLSHAHSHGLIHRDIKPENVLLSDDHAVLADFGIARALDRSEDGQLTRTGMSVGTPRYMSPEQWEETEPDVRCDLYSLGCVAFEMLTGDPPFEAATPATLLAAHATEPVPAVRDHRPEVPRRVEAALERILAKDPGDRYASANAFVEALDRKPGPAGTDDRRLGGWSWPVASWLRANWRGAGLTLVLAAAAVLAASALVPSRDDSLAADRVAVGLFQNRTGDPGLDDLGPMAADWITGGLQRTGILKVVPSPTALQASNFVTRRIQEGRTGDPLAAYARETGAGVIVTGSYYLDGGEVEFQVQVSDASEGNLIGALEPVRGSRSDPESIVEPLRKRVMGLLAVSRDERLARTPSLSLEPPSYEAYRAFNQGLEAYVQNRYSEALPHLYRAQERDSTFTLPLLYAAINHFNLRQFAAADSVLQRVAADRPDLTDYHRHWLEYLEARLRGNNARARIAIRNAAELAPGSKATYNAAWMAIVTNRPAEALANLQLLHPQRGAMRGWFPYWRLLTGALHRLGRHEEELAASRRALRLYPDRAEAVKLEGDAKAALGRAAELVTFASRVTEREGALAGELMTELAVELRIHGWEEDSERLVRVGLNWFETRSSVGENSRDFRAAHAGAHQVAGNWNQAYTLVDRLARKHPEDSELRVWRGILAAGVGREDEARSVYDWLQSRSEPYSFGLNHLHRARIDALLGREDAAVAALRSALSEGLTTPRHLDVNFAGIRDHPGLRALLDPRG